MSSIVDLQSAGGAFSWGPVLERALKKTLKEAMAAKPTKDLQDKVWITALVVALFKETMAKDRDVWELVADKAEAFLKREVGEEKRKEVLKKAAKIVQA